MKTTKNRKRVFLWKIRELMLRDDIRSAAELQRRLSDLGVDITPTHMARIVFNKPQRMTMDILEGLATIFQCEANDLLMVMEIDDATGDCLPPAGTGSQNVTPQGKERKKSGRKLSVVASGDVPDAPKTSPG